MTDSKRLPRIPTPESIARIIASHLGSDWEFMCPDKQAWTECGGVVKGRPVDVNAPTHRDCLDAAEAVLGHVSAPVRLTRTEPPTEPGWYWARFRGDAHKGDRARPVYAFINEPGFDLYDWFGPLDLPEVSP